jgi:hypothetical protein
MSARGLGNAWAAAEKGSPARSIAAAAVTAMANLHPGLLEVAITVARSTVVVTIVIAAIVLRNTSAAVVVSLSVVGAVM